MPVEIWAYIMDIRDAERKRAATLIQARFKGFLQRVRRLGYVRYFLRYMFKGGGLIMPTGHCMSRSLAVPPLRYTYR